MVVHAHCRPVHVRLDIPSTVFVSGVYPLHIARAHPPPPSPALPCRDEATVGIAPTLPNDAVVASIQSFPFHARIFTFACAHGARAFERGKRRRLSSAAQRIAISLCTTRCHRRQAARCPVATLHGTRVTWPTANLTVMTLVTSRHLRARDGHFTNQNAMGL